MNPFLRSIQALNASGNRYVIVGGFAVVMHGVGRFTPDMNVVVELDAEGAGRTVRELLAAEFAPASGTDAYDFLKPEYRRQLHDQNRLFYSFKDPQAPTFSVDLFLDYPLDFEALLGEAQQFSVDGIPFSICSRVHLVEMKLLANRGQDRIDVESLRLVDSVLEVLHDQRACDTLIAGAESDFERTRIHDLVNFVKLTPEAKLHWLVEMLTHLGKFCLLE